MAKSRKAKARAGARRKSAAKARHAAKHAVKARAKSAVSRPRQPVVNAKAAKPLAKSVLPAKIAGKIAGKVAGKVPQRMDKAALKKALLDERIARAQLQAKGKGGRRSTRGLTAKEKALVKEFERRELSPADAEARRTRLKNLIVLGKERSYLTYAEINDHLPDDMLDAEQIENVIGMINDMGIQVYDEAPDAETLLMSEATPPVADEEAVEEAEAALSTVDSEFGRTTDPVRMYMREMGSVELLTREGEIEIAKRIEDGLRHMIQAIAACPTTIAEILGFAERIEKDEIRADELIDGLIDPNAKNEPIQELAEEDEGVEDELEAAEEEDEEGAAAQTADQLKLKADALRRFAVIRSLYGRMTRRSHATARGAALISSRAMRFWKSS